MNVELVEDGIKITLDPEEYNVVRTQSEVILNQLEMQLKIDIRACIAVAALGEDRMYEILKERGLLDGNDSPSLAELGGLVDEVLGRDVVNRIIASSTKDAEDERR